MNCGWNAITISVSTNASLSLSHTQHTHTQLRGCSLCPRRTSLVIRLPLGPVVALHVLLQQVEGKGVELHGHGDSSRLEHMKPVHLVQPKPSRSAAPPLACLTTLHLRAPLERRARERGVKHARGGDLTMRGGRSCWCTPPPPFSRWPSSRGRDGGHRYARALHLKGTHLLSALQHCTAHTASHAPRAVCDQLGVTNHQPFTAHLHNNHPLWLSACEWSVCDRVQYSTMEGRLLTLLSELDVEARSGGGVAERLYASGCHVVAGAEVEIGERSNAAHDPHALVRNLVAGGEVETSEQTEVSHCSHALVCHPAAVGEVERREDSACSCLLLAAPHPSPCCTR